MITRKSKVISLLGFAQKAGKVTSGEEGVSGAVKSHKAKLVLLAADAAENTKKNYLRQCARHHITCEELLTKEELGSGIGKIQRAVLAVTDESFAKAILELLEK